MYKIGIDVGATFTDFVVDLEPGSQVGYRLPSLDCVPASFFLC